MRKKGLPELILKVVMSFLLQSKSKVRVGSKLSKEFLVQVGVL